MNQVPDTAPTQRRTFIERTNQSRRFRVTSFLLNLTGWGWPMIFIIMYVRDIRSGFHLAIIFATVLVANVAAFIANFVSVRCPQCRTFVVWYSSKTARLNSETCPKCGYVPQSDNSPETA